MSSLILQKNSTSPSIATGVIHRFFSPSSFASFHPQSQQRANELRKVGARVGLVAEPLMEDRMDTTMFVHTQQAWLRAGTNPRQTRRQSRFLRRRGRAVRGYIRGSQAWLSQRTSGRFCPIAMRTLVRCLPLPFHSIFSGSVGFTRPPLNCVSVEPGTLTLTRRRAL